MSMLSAGAWQTAQGSTDVSENYHDCVQEMYYRHLYATVQPTLEQRCESWDNYCALFNIILTSSINMQVR